MRVTLLELVQQWRRAAGATGAIKRWLQDGTGIVSNTSFLVRLMRTIAFDSESLLLRALFYGRMISLSSRSRCLVSSTTFGMADMNYAQHVLAALLSSVAMQAMNISNV